MEFLAQVMECAEKDWDREARKGTPDIVEELFSARVPKSSAEVRRVIIHDIKEGEGVGQQEQQGDKRDDEEGDEVKGEVEEIRSNAHSAHET